jgi:hypothetical protein
MRGEGKRENSKIRTVLLFTRPIIYYIYLHGVPGIPPEYVRNTPVLY